MMTAYFISEGSADMPRWREAFSDAETLTPDQADRVSRGDCAWIMSSLENWRELVQTLAARGAHIVVLAYRPEAEEALRAIEAGARGYTHALAAPATLRQVSTVITHQGIWVPAELMARVVGGTFRALGGTRENTVDDLSELTERERAVAEAVLEGLSNKEVARKLDITERTVKAHLGAVFNKLGVRDRIQLVLRLSRRNVEAASRSAP